MALLEELLEANAAFAATRPEHEATMPAAPRKHLAVVACMDSRNCVEKVLGLEHGDAKIIRNAGNHVDDSALRSLVVGIHLLGVKTVVVMGHTQCGMTVIGQGDERIQSSVAATTQTSEVEAHSSRFREWLGGITDTEEQVRSGMQKIRDHAYIPDDIEVIGLLYENETGKVRVVE